MKHSLLLAVIATGLCCMATTPVASVTKRKAQSKITKPVNITSYNINTHGNRVETSRQLPGRLNAYYYYEEVAGDGMTTRDTSELNLGKISYTDDGIISCIYRNGWVEGFNIRDTTELIFNEYNLLARRNMRFFINAPSNTSWWRNETMRCNYDGSRFTGYLQNSQLIETDTTYNSFDNYSIIYTPAGNGQNESLAFRNISDYGTSVSSYTVLESEDNGAPIKVDYTMTYKDNTRAHIVVSGIKWNKTGNMAKLREFDINTFNSPYSVEDVPLSFITGYCKNGENDLRELTVTLDEEQLKVGLSSNNDTLYISTDGSDTELPPITKIYREPASNDLYIYDDDTVHIQCYPADVPDFLIHYLSWVPAEHSYLFDVLRPTVLGDRLYSQVPFELEYDNQGRLTRVKYRMSQIETTTVSGQPVTGAYYAVVECSDYTPYTSVAQIHDDNGIWRAVGGNGSITVVGVDGQVSVWAVSGRLMYGGRVAGETTVNVPAGIYLVKAGDMCRKVVVR